MAATALGYQFSVVNCFSTVHSTQWWLQPAVPVNQSSVRPQVRDDPADRAITTEATRSPPAPVRVGFTSDKTPRTTRKPFTAFNNLNIPIKSPQRLQDIKITRNRTRTVPRIPKKVEKSRKSKNKKGIKNKNKGRKPKQFEEDRRTDDVKADFAEDDEPTPEPEPTGGHHGDPRHHAFHSCKYRVQSTVCLLSNIVNLTLPQGSIKRLIPR